MTIEQLAWQALYSVQDPEIGINVVDLGLIRELTNDSAAGLIRIIATLTSAACPLEPFLTEGITKALAGLSDRGVAITWQFTPPWSASSMSDEGVEQLRALGAHIPNY